MEAKQYIGLVSTEKCYATVFINVDEIEGVYQILPEHGGGSRIETGNGFYLVEENAGDIIDMINTPTP